MMGPSFLLLLLLLLWAGIIALRTFPFASRFLSRMLTKTVSQCITEFFVVIDAFQAEEFEHENSRVAQIA